MKKVGLLLILSLFSFAFLFAQQDVLQKGINYQAVARDAKGQILSEKNIALQFDLISIEKGAFYYSEIHRVTTNNLGLFNLVIGNGKPVQGDFTTVPWGTEDIWMETAIDESGGSDFTVVNTSRLLAVPYAFHANTASALTEGAVQGGVAGTTINTTDVSEACPCKGGYSRLELYYFGDNDVNIQVFRDPLLTSLITSFTAVKSGTLLNVDASGMPGGKFEVKTYLLVTNPANQQQSATELYTDCPKPSWPGAMEDLEILGKTFGSFTVFSHTDLTNNIKCTMDKASLDWHVGGNVVAPDDNRIGTRTYDDLVFVTNDKVRLTITKDGKLITADSIGLELGGNLTVHGDSVEVDHNLYVADTTFARSLTVKDNVPDGGFVATFENTNDEDGDGIKIKLGKIGARNYNGSDDLNAALKTFTQLGLDSDGLTNLRKLVEGDYNSPPSGQTEAIEYFVKKGFESSLDATNAEAILATAIGLVNNLSEPLVDELRKKLNEVIPGIPEQTLYSGQTWKTGLSDVHTGPLSWLGIKRFNIPDVVIPPIKTPELNLPDIPYFSIPDIPNDFLGEGLKFLDAGLRLTNVNLSSLSSKNTFIQFIDQTDTFSLGAIKAQSIEEWAANYLNEVYFYKIYSTFSGIDKTKIIPELKNQANQLAEAYLQIGVEYSSGNGDYAEWLERIDPKEAIGTGDIVAVKGGKITKDLRGAEQVMAVSHHPIVLGNIPPDGKAHLGNNIAFMGQIPVKIMGPVATGDYIVGKSEIPGYGIAIHPAEMTIEDFKLAVGRSWEDNPNSGPKMVNTVIGVHNGDYLNILKRYDQKFKDAEARLQSVEAKVDVLSELIARKITN